MSLGPLQLARLALHLKVLVTFRAAEAEYTGIVANEGDALGRIYRPRAEMAGFNPGKIMVRAEA